MTDDRTTLEAREVLQLLRGASVVHLEYPDRRDFPVQVIALDDQVLKVRGELPAAAPTTPITVRFGVSGDATYRLHTTVSGSVPSPVHTELHLHLPDDAERYEMRRHSRAIVRIVARLARAEERTGRPPEWATAHIRDISTLGVGILCDAPLEHDEIVFFDAVLDGMHLQSRARVIRIESAEPFTRFGLEFEMLDDDNRRILDTFTNDHA